MRYNFFWVFSLIWLLVYAIDLVICQNDFAQEFKRYTTPKIYSVQKTLLDLHFGQQMIIPLNIPKTKYKQFEEDIIIGQVELVLIQVVVNSDNLYKVYYRQEGSFQQELLQSIDGVHFFKFIILKDKKIEIVLRNTKYEKYPIFLNNKVEFLSSKNIINYSIDVLRLEKNTCPFDCFGRGSCQESGECLCQEGYSAQFYCQYQINGQYIQFNSQTRIFEQTNDATQVEQKNEEWTYQTIDLLNDQLIQNQIALNMSSQMKPLSISIIIEYQQLTEAIADRIILLEGNKSFRVINNQKKQIGNKFLATIEIKYLDLQQKHLTDFKSLHSIVLGHKGCKYIDLTVKFNYLSQEGIAQVFTLTFMISFSLILLYIFALLLKKNKTQYFSHEIQQIISSHLDQSQIQLNVEQVNQHIQTQMPSFQYISPNSDDLNGTHYECFICLSKYQDLEECRITKCGHVFHKNCVDAWLQKSLVCPVDRVNLHVKC